MENLIATEDTLRKVHDAMVEVGISSDIAVQAIHGMQNKGVYFREFDKRPHSRACGVRNHPHGSDCSSNCPTCGGKPNGA